MKNLFYFILLAFFTLSACNSTAQKETSTQQPSVEVNYNILTAAEFKVALGKEENPQLIDVRTTQEFEAGSIIGAKNYDILNGSFKKKLGTLNKNKPVYVFCRSGGRSGKASAMLQKNGFTHIIDLKGGFDEWSR